MIMIMMSHTVKFFITSFNFEFDFKKEGSTNTSIPKI
jgi:hypothetical protein